MSTGGQTDVAAPGDAGLGEEGSAPVTDANAAETAAAAESATVAEPTGEVEPAGAEAAGAETAASDDVAGSDDDDSDDDSGDDSGDSDSDSGAEGSATAGSGRRSSRSRSSVEELEEEGDVAADYLEELLDIVDVDGDIDIDVENGRASLAIIAESGNARSLKRLVGANGEVLEALQELTRLAVQASTGDRSRLMLDIAGHRAARRQVLSDKASEACAQVKASGESIKLAPMTAFERKIVHDVVAEAGLNSESEGAEPNRRVVILPS